jgi:hypothetical protein
MIRPIINKLGGDHGPGKGDVAASSLLVVKGSRGRLSPSRRVVENENREVDTIAKPNGSQLSLKI